MSNEVALTKQDIETLKSLYPINQTLKIVGNQKELHSKNAISTIAVITNLETEIPRTFCIYDLREFTTVLSIIENPVLDFSNDKFVVIKSQDGKQKLRYMDGSENLINSYFDKVFKLPSEDIVATITAAQLKSVMNAALGLKLEYVGFRSVDGKIYFTAFDRNNGSGNETNSFSIEVGETSNQFEMYYKTDSLTVLDGDVTFNISSSKISRIDNGNRVFWMTMEAESSFE